MNELALAGMPEGIQGTMIDGAGLLLRRLALIGDVMIEIAGALRANAAVREVISRGCDVRRLSDEFRHPGEPYYCFDAYVEVETHSGDVVWWTLELSCHPTGWELTRRVGKRGRDGEETLVEFPDVLAQDIEAFERSLSRLMEEFSASAKTFDFAQIR